MNAKSGIAPAVAEQAEIHDLGYRRYEGVREGSRGATRALFMQGLRTLFGIGRPLKAKVVPVFVPVVTMLPVLGTLAAASVSNGQVPIRYGMLFAPQLILFVLFAAAQVPEVLSRDQQHRVLPLMLTRDLTRAQYAWARLASVWMGMFFVALAPLVLAWIGEIGIAKTPADAFKTTIPKIGPLFLLAVTAALMIGSVAAAVASFTPRRAWATAGVIGAFLVTAAIAAGMRDLAGMPYFTATFVDPIDGLRTLALILFDEKTRALELNTPPPNWQFLAVQAGITIVATSLLQWRMRKVMV